MSFDFDEDACCIEALKNKIKCSTETATHVHYTILTLNDAITACIESIRDQMSYQQLESVRKMLLVFVLSELKDYDDEYLRMATESVVALWEQVLPVGEKLVREGKFDDIADKPCKEKEEGQEE